MDIGTNAIAWNDSYSLGNKLLDMQHRRLFDLLGKLVESCEDGSETIKVHEALVFLVEYTVRHFSEEEALQVESNFPDYEMHKALHEEFKQNIGALVQKFRQNGSSRELNNDIRQIVVTWLLHHIPSEDKKIAIHVESLRG